MNPAKCVFFAEAGDFLGFLVHQRGIEIPKDKAQAAFDRIKDYLTNPPVLIPPREGTPLKLYIAATDLSIGGLLAQDDENGVEHAVYYLSRVSIDCETRYSPMEKLCLALYFAGCKLRHYMLAFTTVVIAQSDLAVKGQAIADFLAHHPPSELTAFRELEFAAVALAPWTLYFDGSRTDTAAEAGIAIENPAGDRFSYSSQLDFKCTNNQAEYEALIIGLKILLDLGVREVQAFAVLDQFDDVYIEHFPREFNFAANELAQVASGLSLRDGVRERLLKVKRRTLPSFIAREQFQADTPEVAALDPIDKDWRLPFIAYL
ncbi:PREDICTED: uncharacterized protein LOC101314226 [Fragaria vesca subsp. vesca]